MNQLRTSTTILLKDLAAKYPDQCQFRRSCVCHFEPVEAVNPTYAKPRGINHCHYVDEVTMHRH